MPRWEAHVAVTTTVVDKAKECQELRPRSETRVHRIWIPRFIVPQPLEEPRDRVVLLVHLALRHQPSVFGVQNEDKTHQRGKEAAVDVVRSLAQRLVQERAVRVLVRALESAHKFPQRLEYLSGQLGGDLVLIPTALFEERRQPLRLLLNVRHPLDTEQRAERADHGPAER